MTKVLAIIATVLCLALPVTAGFLFLSSTDGEETPAETPATAETQPTTAGSITTPEDRVVIISRKIRGMQCDTVKEGNGRAAVSNDRIDMHYTGWTDDFNGRKKFDSSRDRGQPFTFTLGAGRVIKGWDLGVAGMRPGEVRRLTIPPELGYRAKAKAKIPANSTLYFEVEFLGLADR